MPRRTRLALISERPATDEEKVRMAELALDEAEAAEHPLVPPADIVAALRAQNEQLAFTANAAVEQANEERARVTQLAGELDQAKTDKASVQRAALEKIEQVRQAATAQVAADRRQAQTAERAVVAASLMQNVVGGVGALISFLVDRAPVLLTLCGGYLLARSMLPDPSVYQLALLGIYGGVTVLPAVYLSVRRP